jgi:EpsI family protein
MSREALGTAALVAALLAVGAAAWALELRPPLRVDASKLAQLPHRVGDWDSVDIPLEQSVESMLRADFNVQRAYSHPLGDLVWLYVGYYGTERGGLPEHTPAECYRAHGWEILERRTLEVDPGLRVNEYLVQLGPEQHLVQFWYRSFRRTGLLGGFDQTFDRLRGRLFQGRADGSLVRISTPLGDGDLIPARSRLLRFAAEIDRQLGAYWPDEVAGAGGRAVAWQGPQWGIGLSGGQGAVPAQARPEGPGGPP